MSRWWPPVLRSRFWKPPVYPCVPTGKRGCMVLEFCKCSWSAPHQGTGMALDYSSLYRYLPLHRGKHSQMLLRKFFLPCQDMEMRTFSSQFTTSILKLLVTWEHRIQTCPEELPVPAAATFNTQHFPGPQVSGKGAKSCQQDKNIISNFWKFFSHVFWLWIPMGFYFSSNIVFLWPLLNVDALITHTNSQLCFGSHWIPAGHQPWLIISWVTAEHAQMLGVGAAWPSAFPALIAEVISQQPLPSQPPATVASSGVINAFTGQEQQQQLSGAPVPHQFSQVCSWRAAGGAEAESEPLKGSGKRRGWLEIALQTPSKCSGGLFWWKY